MTDEVSDIAAFYNSDPQREHNRLERHQLEYELTWRWLERCLPPTGSILEIGAATGRYTVALARRGYAVTAADMSAALLEENHKNVAAAGLKNQVRFVAADARDLSALGGEEYDAVLLMGPLYHLVIEADRALALRQACAHLRSGGPLFSAFISRFGIFGDLMKNVPTWIEDQEEVRSFLARGRDPDGYHPGAFRGYFAQLAEIAPLHEAAGLQTLHLVGVEPAISADDESYNRLQGCQRQLWLDLLDQVSTEPTTLAASRHLLYIGKKK